MSEIEAYQMSLVIWVRIAKLYSAGFSIKFISAYLRISIDQLEHISKLFDVLVPILTAHSFEC